jgi:hypothetical protein
MFTVVSQVATILQDKLSWNVKISDAKNNLCGSKRKVFSFAFPVYTSLPKR